MGNSGTGSQPNQQDLTRFWQALMTAFYRRSTIMAAKWQQGGADSAAVADLLKKPLASRDTCGGRATASGLRVRTSRQVLGIMAGFDDSRLKEFMAFAVHRYGANAGLEEMQCRR